MSNPVRRQGNLWIGTIAAASGWEPALPAGVTYLKGQLEEGEGGFRHYQVFVITSSKQSVHGIRRLFEPVSGHWELTRSTAAEEYVWKETTRVGEQFEFGSKPVKRNSAADWEKVKSLAIAGNILEIPADIFVRYYRSLTSIASDNSAPVSIIRSATVYWGRTGSGKSRRAWDEAGDLSYSKDPRTKFWCGYRSQKNVVIDEFRGSIDISHILRWLDRYPVSVEVKGSSKPLFAEKFWFTSNIHPRDWYPDLDSPTLDALLRRLEIVEMN